MRHPRTLIKSVGNVVCPDHDPFVNCHNLPFSVGEYFYFLSFVFFFFDFVTQDIFFFCWDVRRNVKRF